MVGNHPNFIGVLGRVVDAATGQAGLVLPQLSLDKYKILGNAPSFTTITRDTFPIGTDFSLAFIMRVLAGIAAACLHLHRNCGIMHGDLYAHNILTRAQHVRDHAEALLTDFGAASFVATGSAEAALLERIEIRAFGCLVEDMLDHHHLSTATSATATATSATSATASASATETDGAGGEFTAAESECVRGLAELLRDCKMESVEARPSFTTVVQRLAALQAATPSLLR